MPLILFNTDDSEIGTARGQEEVAKTIGPLETKPELIFCPGPDQIEIETNKIDVLVVKAEFDGLEGLPLALDLDTLYYLNSKAALYTSGLPRYVKMGQGEGAVSTTEVVYTEPTSGLLALLFFHRSITSNFCNQF